MPADRGETGDSGHLLPIAILAAIGLIVIVMYLPVIAIFRQLLSACLERVT